MHPGKDPLQARRLEPELMLQQAGEHRAIIGQHRIVAILEQCRLLDLDLLAGDTATIDAATHDPVHAAVTVVGAAVAILAKRAPEFGNHDDDGIAPAFWTDLFRETGEPAAEFAEAIGEIARRRALIDMRVPAADIDE